MAGGQVFMSHRCRDHDVTDELARVLRDAGIGSAFVDYDPVDGIPPGRDWQRELYRMLRACDVVVAVCTPSWAESKWCFAEVAFARALDTPVIPLLVGGDHPDLLTAFQGFPVAVPDRADAPGPSTLSEESLAPLLLELRRLLGARGPAFRWDPDRVPYPGLTPLQAADAAVFFGRSTDVRDIVGRLDRLATYAERSLLLLVGASGCGKSSLLRAGVIPRLPQPPWRPVGPLLPDDDLGAALAVAGFDVPAGQDAPAVLAAAAAQLGRGERLLLALDQVEEMSDGEGGARLLAALPPVLRGAPGRVVAAGTVRADHLGAVQEALLGDQDLLDQVVVEPLTTQGLREIIVAPAEVAGVDVEPDLVDALLDDLAGAGALPLLAFTLRQLWDERGGATEMRLDAYRRLGGVSGAVSRRADAILAASNLSDDDRDGLRRAFLGMVRISRDGAHARRLLPSARLSPRIRTLLERFVRERLLIAGRPDEGIELAHEAIIREWPLLADWVEADRENLVRVERFESDLGWWRDDPSALLGPMALVEAEELTRLGVQAVLGDEPQRFIAASRQAQDAALAREVAAEQTARLSESLRLAAEARGSLGAEPETALLVAWQALDLHANPLSEEAFREALAATPGWVRERSAGSRVTFLDWAPDGSTLVALDQTGRVTAWGFGAEPRSTFSAGLSGTAAHFLPGTDLLVTADPHRELALWRLDGARLASAELPGDGPLTTHGGIDPLCLDVAAGSFVLTSVDEGFAGRIDPDGGVIDAWPLTLRFDIDEVLAAERDPAASPPVGHFGPVLGARLHPSGEWFVSEGGAGIHVWGLDGRHLRELRTESSPWNAAFLHDGDLLAIGFEDGTGVLWDPETGEERGLIPVAMGRDLMIDDVAAGGRLVACHGGGESAVAVVDSSGDALARLDPTHAGDVRSTRFTAGGEGVVIGTATGWSLVWDWRRTGAVTRLPSRPGRIEQVAPHPHVDEVVATGSSDGDVRLWHLSRDLLPALEPAAEAEEVVAIARAGTNRVVVDADTGVTRVWSPADGRCTTVEGSIRAQLGGTDAGEGDRLATVDRNGTARLWQVTGLTGGDSPVASLLAELPDAGDVALSPTGDRLLTWSGTRASVWSGAGERLATLDDTEVDVPRGEMRMHRGWRWGGFAGDAATFTGAENGVVAIWRPGRAGMVTFVTDDFGSDNLLDLAGDPRGDYVLTGIRRSADLWSLDGELVRRLPVGGYKTRVVRFSPDGSLIVTSADGDPGSTELWHRTGDRVATLCPDSTRRITFDVEGRYVAVGVGSRVDVFDAEGERVARVAGPQGAYPTFVDLCPTAPLLLVTLSDGTVAVWDLHERRKRLTLTVGDVPCACFTHDGARIVLASPRGGLTQQSLVLDDLLASAAERVDRTLTDDEAVRFGIDPSARIEVSQHRA